MTKVACTIPAARFERFDVHFPKDWEIVQAALPYTTEQLTAACAGADFLFVGSMDRVEAQVFEKNPQLKLAHVEGVGFDKVDLEAAKKAGVRVCNNRATNNGAVAEHTIGLMLAAMRRTAVCNAEILADGFAACQKKQRAEGEIEIGGKHIGLVGAGAIGREVAKRLMGWDVRVSYYDAFRPSPEVEQQLHIDYMEFDELVRSCDIISMHVPVLPSTLHMMGEKQFKAMKRTAYLINTARGEVIDQDALVSALESGEIAGAALDTLTPEPAPADLNLLNMSETAQKKLTLTPHIGGTTNEAFTRMLRGAIANFQRVQEGEEPINVVNA